MIFVGAKLSSRRIRNIACSFISRYVLLQNKEVCSVLDVKLMQTAYNEVYNIGHNIMVYVK